MYEITQDAITGKITIASRYGDRIEGLTIELAYADGSVAPPDAEDEIVLGVAQKNKVYLNIVGTLLNNVVTFNIPWDTMAAANMKVGSYDFDIWNRTKETTMSKLGKFKLEKVAHTIT